MNLKKQYIYPKNANGIETYRKDNQGKEIYISHNNINTYCFHYPTKEEMYATDKDGIPYYASFTSKEIYAVSLQKDMEKFITINNENIYCTDSYGNEYYPRNFVGHEKVANEQFYAVTKDKNSFYPLNNLGDEYAIPDKIILKNNEPVAPLKRDGTVNYLKINDSEIPYKYNNEEFIGYNLFNQFQYPVNKFGDEFYPGGTSPIFISKPEFKYALSKTKEIIYPKYPDGEHYLSNEYGSYNILKNFSVNFKRYVSRNNKYFYPTIQTTENKTAEMIMHNLYAKNNNKNYYPKDSNSNEYLNSNGDMLDSYPLTSDGYIIIPNFMNSPLFKKDDVHLVAQIQCLLFRPDLNTYDFLINCSSKNYPILQLNMFKPFIFHYIIAGLCSIIFILCLVLIIKR